MRKCLIGIFGLLLFPDAALACGKAELRTFLELAQSLSPRTESEGARLLTCPGETAEASQWLAFYRDVSGNAPKPPLPRVAAAQTAVPGEVGRAIVLAYAGAYEALRAKIDSGDPRYTAQGETYLAVGRMLIRNHRF